MLQPHCKQAQIDGKNFCTHCVAYLAEEEQAARDKAARPAAAKRQRTQAAPALSASASVSAMQLLQTQLPNNTPKVTTA